MQGRVSETETTFLFKHSATDRTNFAPHIKLPINSVGNNVYLHLDLDVLGKIAKEIVGVDFLISCRSLWSKYQELQYLSAYCLLF